MPTIPNYDANITGSAVTALGPTGTTVSVIGSAFGDFVITESPGIFTVTWDGGTLAQIAYRTYPSDAVAEETSRAAAFNSCSESINTKIAQLGDDARETLSRDVQIQIRDIQAQIRDIHQGLANDIHTLRVLGAHRNKGIVTRETCVPCPGVWGSAASRAMTVTALRDSKQLDDVIREINNPTAPELDITYGNLPTDNGSGYDG